MRHLIVASVLLLATHAAAINIPMAADPIDDAGLTATDYLPRLAFPWSINATRERIIGDFGDPLNEAAVVADGLTVVIGYNNSGFQTNAVGYAITTNGGATWRDQYTPITFRNPYARDGSLVYSSDPTIAACKDRRGRRKYLVGSVSFGLDLTEGGEYHCDANTAFAITGTLDKGVHWDRVHPIDDGGGRLRDRPSLACDPNSPRCWAFYNGYVAALPPGGDGSICEQSPFSPNGPTLYVQTSGDCGSTWSAPLPVSHTWMPPTNMVVLANGHARFALFSHQYQLDIYDCDPTGICTTLHTIPGAAQILAAGDDHAHLQGLDHTRFNSDPVIACHPDGTKCSVAWMNQFGELHGLVYQATVLYTTSTDSGTTWTAWARIPQNLYNADQVLPILSWGYTEPGLCWYQRERQNLNPPGDHTFDMLCATSPDYGVTWSPPENVDVPTIIQDSGLSTQRFLGDYNGLDARGHWLVYTSILHAGDYGYAGVNGQPYIRMVNWNPDGCQVGPMTSARSAWWLVLPLLTLLARRHARALVGAALVLALALPVRAMEEGAGCMGDCDGDGVVAVNEIILNIAIGLDLQPGDACLNPVDFCGPLPIPCLTKAVANLLDGCPAQ